MLILRHAACSNEIRHLIYFASNCFLYISGATLLIDNVSVADGAIFIDEQRTTQPTQNNERRTGTLVRL